MRYTDLNEYMHLKMGTEFTIKDFRTYGANFHMVYNLLD